MKNFKIHILSLLVLFLFSFSANTQDSRTLQTKIADILAQMPAKSNEQLDKNLAQILSLNNEGASVLLSMLQPAGQGDDVAVRFTLTSLARYSSQKGHEAEWNLIQQNFLKAIETSNNVETQAYLIHQLNYGANNDAVEPLKKYLKHERLAEPVTQLFLNIKSALVEKTLTEALEQSTGKIQVTLVKALGELESKNCAGAIGKLAGSGNTALERAVLAALANIAEPLSYNIIWNSAQKVSFRYEATEATASFLKYADKIGRKGETKLCKQACLALMESGNAGELLHNKAAATEIYSRYFPKEAMAFILKNVNTPDSSYRMAMLNTALHLGDVSFTQKWIKTAQKAEPNIKSDIIYMLGERNDKTATPFVLANIADNSPKVRKMAIWALVKLDPMLAETELLNSLSKGNDVAETENALKTLLNEKKLDQVVNKLSGASNSGKAGLINLMAAKSGKRFFSTIYGYTSDPYAATKLSAIAALKRVSSSENISDLLKLLYQLTDPTLITNVQDALIAALKTQDADIASKPLVAELKGSQPEKIIPVLSALGGHDAVKEVASIFETATGNLKQVSFKALVSWKNSAVAPYLLEICKTSGDEFKPEAFKGYVNIVRRSDWFDDQKLLKLQMIMPYAVTAGEKELVINALSRVKTFLSLVYTGKFLDDPQLQRSASFAVAQIALPENDSRPGFTGDIPRAIIQKAINVISGDESEYVKANMKKFLDNMPAHPGFVSMFNGVDLTGWKGFVTDPIKLATLKPKDLEKLQKEANEKMHFNWKVQDGMIVFNGDGNNLLSDRPYSDFEMIVNWKISKKGDSGIYLRGTPQVQIWDTTRREVGAQVGSGGLYNNKKNPDKPLKVADNPIEEWNTFRITMIDEKVTVYLNGELVVDNVTLENYWDRNLPIFPSGTVELQAHGTNLAFKDIYIREIHHQEIMLSPQEGSEGFVSLFNGKNLDGWIGNKKSYVAEDGNIVIKPSEGEGGGNLFTDKEYGDFIFRFEFQLTPGANNGLGVRAPLEGDAAYTGMELQILDNTAAIYANLKPYQYHGSVYGIIPAKREFLKPLGEWNYQEVQLKGSKIKITLNGTVIVEGDISEASKNGTADGKEHPGLMRKKGHIGFLGHGSLVKFRNIRIKEI